MSAELPDTRRPRRRESMALVAAPGVPGVLPLARVDQAAVNEGVEAAPDGKAAADARCVHVDGRGAAGEPVAVWGVVKSLGEVEGSAAQGAHPVGDTDVGEDAVRARLPRGIRRPWGHLVACRTADCRRLRKPYMQAWTPEKMLVWITIGPIGLYIWIQKDEYK
jgi:hypothetical protein